jgi:hypothetical protein
MKGANFPSAGGAVPQPGGNGIHRPGKENGAAAMQAPAATFITIQPKPVDAQTWLLNRMAWFQPEVEPAPPAWSGLTIERCHRVPAPGFLHCAPAPPDRSRTLENPLDAQKPGAREKIPESGLAPLGWDARLFSQKEKCG